MGKTFDHQRIDELCENDPGQAVFECMEEIRRLNRELISQKEDIKYAMVKEAVHENQCKNIMVIPIYAFIEKHLKT